MAHQLPGDAVHVSSIGAIRPERLWCACLHRQHFGSLIYLRQGGLRSRPLCRLACQILLWTQGKLLSLRTIYIPGHLNLEQTSCEAGAEARGIEAPQWGGWADLEEVWWAQLDCLHQVDLTMSPVVLHRAFSSAGLDAMVQTWPRLLSGGGHHFHPQPRVVQVVGVAPEGAQLIASSLLNWGCEDHPPVQNSLYRKSYHC